MNKITVAASLAILAMTATGVNADVCEKHQKQVSVSGSVETQSYAPTLQAGSIDMQLTTTKTHGEEKVIFDKSGVIAGELTGVIFDPVLGLPVATLDHDINFANGFEIETSGDLATIYGDPFGADVPVSEVIHTFTGSKVFNNATGEITATGFLNIGGTGRNEFALSGSLCIDD